MFSRYKIFCTTILTGLFISLYFISCDKENKSVPDDPYILTETRFARKWEVTEIHLTYYTNNSITSTWRFIKDFGEVRDEQQSGSWIEQEHLTYFIASQNHSFTHTMQDGQPSGFMLDGILPYQNGTWTLKNPTTLELTTYCSDGSLQQIDWKVTGFNYYGLYLKTRGPVSGTTNDEITTELRLEQVQ